MNRKFVCQKDGKSDFMPNLRSFAAEMHIYKAKYYQQYYSLKKLLYAENIFLKNKIEKKFEICQNMCYNKNILCISIDLHKKSA